MQTILSTYFAYFATTLFLFQHTTNCLRHNRSTWKILSCNFVADFRWPQSFLWTEAASSSSGSSSGFPVSTIQQSCNTQPLLSLFLWSDKADRVGPFGKSPHDQARFTNTHIRTASLCVIRLETFSPLTMSPCADRHPAVREKSTSPSSCT